MIKFKARFDGNALLPDAPVKLEKGQTYTVVISPEGKNGNDALAAIASLALPLGPPDLSCNFPRYTGRILQDG